MEEKASNKSTMVSRLPKFGGRSSSNGATPLSNGSTTPTPDGKTMAPATQPNGLIRASPFSLKWKKDDSAAAHPSATSSGERDEDKTQRQLPSLAKEAKNGAPGTPKIRRSGTLMVAVSSPKAIPKQCLKTSPKVGTKLGQSPMNGGPKSALTGSSIPGSDSRLVRSKLTSPRSSSQDSLSQSSDSLRTLELDNMVRSNSFTHFKQIPSPTTQPMIRSFSFNRAVELAKPLANTQLRPPRSSFLKPPQMSNGRVGLGFGGLNGSLGSSGGLDGGLQYSRTPPASSSLPTLSIPSAPSTPSALKKPLFPNCVLTKSLGSTAGALGYRLARSGQAKQQKPLFPGKVKGDVRPSTASGCGESLYSPPYDEAKKADSPTDSEGSSGKENGGKGEGNEALRQSICQPAGETLEDMSLSSASSLDRVDTSEEFLDDFDSTGEVLSDVDIPDNRGTHLHSFLNETTDWEGIELEGQKEDSPMEDSQGPLELSAEHCDAPQASSLELSPSNSSGGTYMWDEEGLGEPLGGLGIHPLDSFDDSELNSMDILNNLDPRGTGELDDDDLMLEVDLPEDGLHDIDRMSHFERSERAGRQGQRRKHHRWSGSDHFHSDSRAHVFQHYDGLKSSRMSSRPPHHEDKQHGFMSTLDDLTLEHMTQDCGSLKNQLLRLKNLLQPENTDAVADAPEVTEDNTAASQLDELIKEVQVLRHELQSRDRTIAQLTMQCQQLQQQQQREQMAVQGHQVRCQCHHQRAPASTRPSDRQTDRRMQHHYDKATQTYWRSPSHAGVLPTPLLSPWQAQHQGLTRTSMPQRRQTSNTTAFQPLPQRAPPPGKNSKNSPHRGPQ